MRFLVEAIALEQVFFSGYLAFPLSVSVRRFTILIFIYTFLSPEGLEGETWESSKKLFSFGNRETQDRKAIQFFLNLCMVNSELADLKTSIKNSS